MAAVEENPSGDFRAVLRRIYNNPQVEEFFRPQLVVRRSGMEQVYPLVPQVGQAIQR